jgi:antitoxin component YwqK of YwqJK toxin-antitoxin module
MGLFDFFRNKKYKSSTDFKNSEECKKILEQIERHNENLKVVHEVFFEEDGKSYKYYFDNTQIRAEGHYYSLGYDKNGIVVDEKFQGKNIQYYDNGNISQIVFYKDGIPTGEFYYFDAKGNPR